jgi:hypothetical protein
MLGEYSGTLSRNVSLPALCPKHTQLHALSAIFPVPQNENTGTKIT